MSKIDIQKEKFKTQILVKSTTDQSISSPEKRFSFKGNQKPKRFNLLQHKKNNIIIKRHRKIKTQNSISNLSQNNRQEFFSQNKSTKLLPPISSMKSEQIISKKSSKQDISDLINDPYLNGRINNEKKKVFLNFDSEPRMKTFLKKVQELEIKVLEQYSKGRYYQALEVVINLLNYSIDLNLIECFCESLKILGDFNFELKNLNSALFYYIQAWNCAFKIRNFTFLVEVSIKISQCANLLFLYEESIKILKKGLQFSWFYESKFLELKVYDQMGKVYYLLGDTTKAKNFHQRYIFSITQQKNSPTKLLSKQSLLFQIIENSQISSITTLFLYSINAPIKNLEQLPQLQSVFEESARKKYMRDMSYYFQFQPAKKILSTFLTGKTFSIELGDVNMVEGDWTVLCRKNKFLSFDIKRNKYLKQKGIQFSKYSDSQKPKIRLLQKFKRDSRELDEWYSGLVREVKRDNKGNKIISNKVEVRGRDKTRQTGLNKIRIMYHQFFSIHLK